eukprot:scaffold65577_cov66-Phaeocystis_antarctica.AAC.4
MRGSSALHNWMKTTPCSSPLSFDSAIAPRATDARVVPDFRSHRKPLFATKSTKGCSPAIAVALECAYKPTDRSSCPRAGAPRRVEARRAEVASASTAWFCVSTSFPRAWRYNAWNPPTQYNGELISWRRQRALASSCFTSCKPSSTGTACLSCKEVGRAPSSPSGGGCNSVYTAGCSRPPWASRACSASISRRAQRPPLLTHS